MQALMHLHRSGWEQREGEEGIASRIMDRSEGGVSGSNLFALSLRLLHDAARGCLRDCWSDRH